MAKQNFIKRIISSPLVQTFLIYLSGGWVALEMTDYFIRKYDLNERISDILSIILLIGLPAAIFFAWFLGREKETIRAADIDKTDLPQTTDVKKPPGTTICLIKRPRYFLPGVIIILLLIVAGVRYLNQQAKIKWANEKALPEIEKLRDEENYPAAFKLLKKADKYIVKDPEYKDLAFNVTTKLTILTNPPGAEVYAREYLDLEGKWEKWGKTPIDSIWLPNFIFYQMRIEKTGYEDVLAVAATLHDTINRKLFPVGTTPAGMVYVDGYRDEVFGDYTDIIKNGFFMDRYEVTNKQYKEFVNHGGYSKQEYWKHEFSKNGKILTWEEAMAEFTDKSGRPGPSTWEASDYPDGQDDYPVSGVCWYEAAAYAKYVNKDLPTVYHWLGGAGLFYYEFRNYFGSFLNRISNFDGKGTEPVGLRHDLGCFGTYNMAGNVREWCSNTTQIGKNVMGGAWDDANYMYSNLSHLPTFDRSVKNGFRCVHYVGKEKIPAKAFQPINLSEERDYYKEEPVSEEIFKIFKNQFLYDSFALEATIEKRFDSYDDYTIEKITFEAAYGNERIIAYLYLPANPDPPFQTIIFFPGAYALREADLVNSGMTKWFLEFLMKNGRAVMYPVYKGTYERKYDHRIIWGQTHQYTDMIIHWAQDFSRSMDYLKTRSDIDNSKIGFYGHSMGGENALIIPAIEDRLKVCILLVGGLDRGRFHPEADPINYVTRIKMPVLMLNGKYDISYPYETSVKPLYDLLGTPEEDKHLHVYETDHFVPKSERIKEILNFLDQYFGPVQKMSPNQ